MAMLVVASLDKATHQTQAVPLLDWMQVACTSPGHNVADQTHSLLDQGWEPVAPNAEVMPWMKAKLIMYWKASLLLTTAPQVGTMLAGPGGLTPPPLAGDDKEYMMLETVKIQAACSLMDGQ